MDPQQGLKFIKKWLYEKMSWLFDVCANQQAATKQAQTETFDDR